MKLKYISFKLLALLPYVFVFIASLYSTFDPDLGWHLKYGEYFIQHEHILRENTFSTLMSSYRWANGSWGIDILTYLIFHAVGFWGLTIVSACIVTATFYFLAKAARLTTLHKIILFPLLIYFEIGTNQFSFKGQQMSFLFIAILFSLISVYERSQEDQKSTRVNPLLFTIPLFFLWVNIHEEFLLGLSIFSLWIIFYLGRLFIGSLHTHILKSTQVNLFHIFFRNLKSQPKQILFLISILFSSILVTIINPYGIGVHLDALSHFGNPLLKYISEYVPLYPFTQLWWNHIIFGILILCSVLVFYFRKTIKINLPRLGIVMAFYILSFTAQRYAWPTYYIGFLLFKPLVDILNLEKYKRIYILETIVMIIVLITIILLKQPFNKYLLYSWNNYCWTRCSANSAEFLKKNHLTKNLFTLYVWGGWLIWNYPIIKPTIDGRMHLWRDKNGYSAFEDYLAYEQNWKDIDNSSYNVVYMSPDKPIYQHMMALVHGGRWALVYQDNLSSVFIRNTPDEWHVLSNPLIYGEYLLSIDKLDEARQQILSSNSQDWRVYHELAFAYEKEKHFDSAIPLEAKAIQLSPLDNKLCDNLAVMLYLSNSPENTIKFTSQKLREFPNDWKLNLFAALGYYQKEGHTNEALTYAQKAYSISQNQVTFTVLQRIKNGESVVGLIN